MTSNKKRIIIVLAILTMALVLSCALVACNKTDTPDAPKNEFTITFDTQGGSEVKPLVLKEGETITLPSNPTKEGSVFDGWYLDSSYTQAFDSTKRIDSNMVLYAKWKILDEGQSIIASDYFDINGLVLTMNKKNYIESTEDVFDLRNKFSTSTGSGWRAFTSPNCDQPTEITTRMANVSAGWNNIYVMVENLTTYENQIYRLKIYKYPTIVYRELNDGFLEIQSVSDCADVLFPDDKIDNITSIGERAFSSCPSLRTLSNLPKLTYIGPSAFANCKSLTSITIPDSVTSIGAYAFDGCSEITSISGSSDVISKVAKQASPKSFVGNITSGTSVMAGAFSGMTGLKGVTIPDSVTSIGSSAFSGCTGLTTVNWNATACTRAGYSGHPIFEGCSNLATVNIGDNVKIIPSSAFYNCTGLTSVTIPDSVTSIGGSAFYGTAWYNNQPDGLVYAGKVAYKYKGTMPSNTSIVLKEGTLGIADYAFAGCTGLTSITIPNSVTNIGKDALYNTAWYNNQPDGLVYAGKVAYKYKGEMPSNTSIVLKEGTLGIGDSAFFGSFFGCKGLTSITIPDSVTSIGENAFGYCTNLADVIISNNVASIGSNAFQYCIGLTSVTIGNGVTSIGEDAFLSCDRLIEVYNKSSLKIIARDSSFGYVAYSAKNVYTEEGGSKLSKDENGYVIYTDEDEKILVAYLGTETELTLPADITQINQYAFSFYSWILRITIPNNVTNIGDYAFYECTGLTSVTIGNSVTSIGKQAFARCKGLTSITIPDSVTSIGYSAFYGCAGLTSVTIGNSVTSIGSSAFEGCTGLTNIKFNGTIAQWNAISKGEYWKYNVPATQVVCTDGTINI